MKKNKEKSIISKILVAVFVIVASYFILTITKLSIADLIPVKDKATEKNIFSYLSNQKEILKENGILKAKVSKLELEQKTDSIDIIENSYNKYKTFPIVLTNSDLYGSLIVKINKEKGEENKGIFLGSLVLSENNTAIGVVDKINLNTINIKYFSKGQAKSYLYFKNANNSILNKSKKEEKALDNAGLNSSSINNITTVNEPKKISILKNIPYEKSFKTEVTGLSNGFLSFEVPREYTISKDSILYYSENNLVPVAYFFEEKSTEQDPIKTIIFKMFENPENLISVKISI